MSNDELYCKSFDLFVINTSNNDGKPLFHVGSLITFLSHLYLTSGKVHLILSIINIEISKYNNITVIESPLISDSFKAIYKQRCADLWVFVHTDKEPCLFINLYLNGQYFYSSIVVIKGTFFNAMTPTLYHIISNINHQTAFITLIIVSITFKHRHIELSIRERVVQFGFLYR